MTERLTKREKNGLAYFPMCFTPPCNGEGCKDENCIFISDVCERLAEYEDLGEQGRLLRLPCKVGDTAYAFLSTNNYFTKCQINKIELKPTLYGNIRYFLEQIGHRGCLYRYFEDDFGKTVFLTKEEAKAKLKEMEGRT